jgi:GT2 family glycosyltransferase
VVSSGRPEALCRCLLGLSQQADAGCEAIVVADRAGLDAIGSLPFAPRIRAYLQATPNISRARNIGVAHAAGEVIAFLDDDAVLEPTWSRALVRAFTDPDLAAATGPVLGRNGISLQWGPMLVTGSGEDLPCDPDAPVRDRTARKLHGTNMAFRRTALERIGGFDEAFAFYLDDTDMALRIALAGLRTTWLRGAVVHHGFEPSARRSRDRVPLSLHDIGASTAVFLRKHADPADHAAALHRLEADQSTRLFRLAHARKIDADAMRRLMETLRDGIADGEGRASLVPAVRPATDPFEALVPAAPPPPVVLSGWPHQLARLRREAADLVAAGQPVSVFCFAPTPRRHKVRFTDGGWWEQTGGLYGASDRSGPRVRFTTFARRLDAEIRRISATRGL